MKIIQVASIVGLSMTLLACGGSGSGSAVGGSGSDSTVGGSGGNSTVDTTKVEFIKSISETSWKKECFFMNSEDLTNPEGNYVAITISINASLESITTVKAFSEPDCNHHSAGPIRTFTTQLEITDKIISEESIEAYGLNTSFIESPDITELAPSYSLIYLDTEKLYFGSSSGSNSGESEQTRHSSISLDDYFRQVMY